MTTVNALKNLYTALGGDPADVADISTNPDMINALCEVASGGNPNTVETITGTVADPWGGRFAEIKAGIATDNMTVTLQVGGDTYPLWQGDLGIYGAMWLPDFIDNFTVDAINADVIAYDNNGVYKAFASYYAGGAWNNTTTSKAATETTLTIINHPMPDNA